MIRPPPKATRTDTLFPYTTLFRSVLRTETGALRGVAGRARRATLLPSRDSTAEGRSMPDDLTVADWTAKIDPRQAEALRRNAEIVAGLGGPGDRKSTRLNSSH